MQRTFHQRGYTVDPDAVDPSMIVGNRKEAARLNGATALDKVKSEEPVRKRKKMGDSSDVDGYLGPWAGYEGEPENGQPVETLEVRTKLNPLFFFLAF